MDEFKEFIKFVCGWGLAIAFALTVIVGMWLGGAWLIGQGKIITAKYDVRAEQIRNGQ